MPACLNVTIAVHDPARFEPCRAQAPAAIAPGRAASTAHIARVEGVAA